MDHAVPGEGTETTTASKQRVISDTAEGNMATEVHPQISKVAVLP